LQVVNDSTATSTMSNIQQTSDQNIDHKPASVTKNSSSVFGAPDWSKTPRNAQCPCGSGKKYKMCHGRVN
ncbi:MAG: SEC-C domain-containing protein, partial [Acidimicrobiaceae bacterium]|nr:SEC-C domain-containing protein [Acidimicrobiaceae bacterium]